MTVVAESGLQRKFRELIFRETGIKMPRSKEQLVASRLRKRLLADGRYFVTHTTYRGGSWLRLTLMHRETTLEDVRGLLDAVRTIAAVPA